MSLVIARNIGKRYLDDLDTYLAQNLHRVTCNDIQEIYYKFFEDLKEFKGNANGFTGLSELLVFRFLYHLLGGSFERRTVQGSRHLFEFVSGPERSLRIAQSARVLVDGRRYYPDIVIFHRDRLVMVAQIKLFLTGGVKTIDQEMATLAQLRRHYPEMQALLIIFLGSKKRGKVLSYLEKTATETQWFKYLILQQNDELFWKVLQKHLGLAGIQARFNR